MRFAKDKVLLLEHDIKHGRYSVDTYISEEQKNSLQKAQKWGTKDIKTFEFV